MYPAGFVYIYAAFYYLTSYGRNIRLAQYIFLVIYIAQLCFTFNIYKKTCKIPAYAIMLSTLTSYRIHSIYVLRLFNDPIAVLLFYISLDLILKNKWRLASLFYSLAVSVKMNILLYSPCLLLAYLTNLTIKETAINIFICGAVQLILGAPFLYGNPLSYIKGSFDLGRVFEHRWTVNYRFLDRSVFENGYFHLALLSLHMLCILMFFPSLRKFLSSYAKLNSVITDLKSQGDVKRKRSGAEKLSADQEKFLNSFEKQLKNRKGKKTRKQKEKNEDSKDSFEINFSKVTQLVVLPFFVTNLIGMTFARSLHYQFYSWYFHSLLYLVHCTPFRKPVVFLLLGLVELCWNTYPSTCFSSALLHVCHFVLLYGVYKVMNQ